MNETLKQSYITKLSSAPYSKGSIFSTDKIAELWEESHKLDLQKKEQSKQIEASNEKAFWLAFAAVNASVAILFLGRVYDQILWSDKSSFEAIVIQRYLAMKVSEKKGTSKVRV